MSLQYLEDFLRPDPEAQGIDYDDDVLVVKWHPQGVVIAGFLKGDLRAWEATTGKPLTFAPQRIHDVGVTSITISDDATRMLTSSLDGAVALWDTSGLGKAAAHVRQGKSNHEAAVKNDDIIEAVESKPGDRGNSSLAIHLVKAVVMNTSHGLKERTKRRQLDSEEGVTPLSTLVVDSHIFVTAMHPTYPIFASAGADAHVTLHSLSNPDLPFGTVEEVIKSGSADQSPRSSQHSPTESRQGKSKGNEPFAVSIVFDARGELVAVGTAGGEVYVYDVDTKELIDRRNIQREKPVRAIAMINDGRDVRLLAGSDSGNIIMFDIVSETQAARTMSSQSQSRGADPAAAALRYAESFSASQYSTRSDSGTLRRQVRLVREWNAHAGFITALKVSADGRLVASCDLSGHVKLWDLVAGIAAQSPVWTSKQANEIWALDWKAAAKDSSELATAAGSSRFVTASGDGIVRWYRAAGSGDV